METGERRKPPSPRPPSRSHPRPSPPQSESRKQDEDPIGKVYDSVLIRRLGRYLKPYWWQAIVSSVSVTIKSIARRDRPLPG